MYAVLLGAEGSQQQQAASDQNIIHAYLLGSTVSGK